MPSSDSFGWPSRRGDRGLPFVVFSPLRGGITPIFLLLLTITGCLQKEETAQSSATSATDDLGNVVSLPAFPQRIVSLAPSTTEILFALHLDSAVAGVTDFCDYPDAARRATRVGGMTNPNYERIVGLNPDLVVLTVSGNARSDYDKLISLGYHVFVSNPVTLEGIYKSIGDMGRLSGHIDEADSLTKALRSHQEMIVNQAAREPEKSVLLLLSLQPLIAAGPNTFIDELIRLANGRNAAADTPTAYPLLSREEILKLQPDVVIVTSDVARSVKDVSAAYPEWKSLRAIQGNRVAIVDANLVTRPGPRVTLGLQALALAIHP